MMGNIGHGFERWVERPDVWMTSVNVIVKRDFQSVKDFVYNALSDDAVP